MKTLFRCPLKDCLNSIDALPSQEKHDDRHPYFESR